MATIKENYND